MGRCRWPARAAFLLVALAAAAPAAAQSAPPIGLWRGVNTGDHIWVRPDGGCSASGTVNIAGYCQWMPTATGGILTLTYQWTIGPGHIRWSIRWIGPGAILVNNVERFVRQG